jgi:hypothetical protein
VTHSTVKANRAIYGGGIRQEWDSRANILGTTIADNYARNSGGGVENGAYASLNICTSTVSGNISDGYGGGVTGTMNHNGTLIVNSTISGNRAGTTGGGVSIWGQGPTILTRSTIAFNHATGNGGGVYDSDSSPLILSNVLLTGNTTNATGPEVYCGGGLCASRVTANKFNLFGHDGHSGVVGITPGKWDVVAAQPLNWILDVDLEDRGGPTLIHALVPGSRAINAGDPYFNKLTFGCKEVYDQRGPGFPRLVGTYIDIGAFEAAP